MDANSLSNKRVLVVDDNNSIHEDFESILKNGSTENSVIDKLESDLFADEESKEEALSVSYEIDHAYQGNEAVEKVRISCEQDTPYALVFMDVRMPPGINGIEAISRIWALDPLTEIVICTAYSDYSWDNIVAKLGTTDKLLFVQKPFNVVEVKQMALSLVEKWNINKSLSSLIDNLEAEVEQRTKQLKDILSKLEVKNKELEELSQRDSMTGLLNHRTMYEHLKSVVNQANRHNMALSVIILDIDNFKAINDRYGHLKGDSIILHLAGVLKESLRDYDVAGRYGGDEFLLIAPHSQEDTVNRITDRIIEKVEDRSSGPNFDYTVSIGGSFVSSDTVCLNCRELVAIADQALYEAKGFSGSRAVIKGYSPEN